MHQLLIITAAAAACWNLIEDKLPSILADLGSDATLLLELAKQCEKDGKIRLAIRLGMGSLRREPEDSGRIMYEYDNGGYGPYSVTSSNQTAITWLLQLITNSSECFSLCLFIIKYFINKLCSQRKKQSC